MKDSRPSVLLDLLKSLLLPHRSADRKGGTGELVALPQPRKPEYDYSLALERSARTVRERQMALERERAEAGGLLDELIAHSPERQALLAGNDRRFHTWGLLELLIERAQESLLEHRPESERLGGLALRVAERLDAIYYGEARLEDMRARSWSIIGESRRLRSDFPGAGEAYDRAHEHLRAGTGDPLERALVLDLEASLRRCERRFEEARRLLRKAIEIFVENGESQRAGLSLVNLSIVHRAEGELARALAVLDEALRRIDGAEEPRLQLCAEHHLIHTLASAGRLMEARGMLLRSRPLYRRFPDAWTQSHLRWLRGQLALGLNGMAEAESELLGARQGFLGLESAYEAGLVGLDLALLYARQDRTAELRNAAGDALDTFHRLGLNPEARAAESFLRQADEVEGAWRELAQAATAFE